MSWLDTKMIRDPLLTVGIAVLVVLASYRFVDPVAEERPAGRVTSCGTVPVVPTTTPSRVTSPLAQPACVASDVVSIKDLPNIVRPTSVITTAALGDRHWREPAGVGYRNGERLVSVETQGVRIATTCGDDWCVDSAIDVASGRAFVKPGLGSLEIGADPRASVERVIRVAYATPRYVSLYIARTEFTGRRPYNTLTCRTFDRKSGRELRLRDLIPAAAAKRVIAQAEKLKDEMTAIDELGAALSLARATFSEQAFRWGRNLARGEEPELILCGETGDSEVRELFIDDLPVLGVLLDEHTKARVIGE